ncbi:hypothetical protein SD71_20050 [Cohnella kolymensis]|uniref:Uncharacterized protein n=1 Tax=Cohnella kolymensis TaxID=1590652 RepID=A0ABR4ZZU5_9BACL|nr:hypothetical protein [Cohnella kolymensis]KIL34339.1 hypothetical protein SD71_20050 [Cohnella kolymensis]
MRSRIHPWFTIVLALMAIGLVSMLLNGGAQSLIIPLIIVAIVFLLYKFPPDRWRKPRYRGYSPGPNRPQPLRTAAKPAKRKASPFTVIEGRKNKEDEPPRYH